VPGAFLLVVLAVPMGVAAVMEVSTPPWAALASIMAGAAQVGWIGAEQCSCRGGSSVGARVAMSGSVDERAPISEWDAAWLGVVNGAIHRLYTGPLGEQRAQQLSGLTFAMLSAPYVGAVDHRWPTRTARAAVGIGMVWSR